MKLIIPKIPVESVISEVNKDIMLHLPTSNTYGNLNIKFMDYNERHKYMNLLLKQIYQTHTLMRQLALGDKTYSLGENHNIVTFNIETLIYWIRKNVDEYIGLLYYFDYWQKEKKEPSKLGISSIGALLNNTSHSLYILLEKHLVVLERINDISNTFKHSFITSEAHAIIGRYEPTVNCLDMKRNLVANGQILHSYYLKQIIEDYVLFFLEVRTILQNIKLEY